MGFVSIHLLRAHGTAAQWLALPHSKKVLGSNVASGRSLRSLRVLPVHA